MISSRFLIEKADCRTVVSSRSVVSFIMHEMLQDPVKRLFKKFVHSVSTPSVAYPVENGTSLTFSTAVQNFTMNIGSLSMVNSTDVEKQSLEIVYEALKSKIIFRADFREKFPKKISDIIYYGANFRVHIERVFSKSRKSSRKSVNMVARSDTKSLKSRKSTLLRKSSSILKPVIEENSGKINFYLENSVGAVISLEENFLLQKFEHQRFLYIDGCACEIFENFVKIYAFNGSIFELKREISDAQHFDQFSAVDKYFFEVNFLKSFLKNEKLPIPQNLTAVYFTAADGNKFLFADEKLFFLERFYCWDSFDYNVGIQTVHRDDGTTFLLDLDQMICRYKNGLQFTTKLDENVVFDDIALRESEETISGLVSHLVDFSTQKDFLWNVTKSISIEKAPLSTVFWQEVPMCETNLKIRLKTECYMCNTEVKIDCDFEKGQAVLRTKNEELSDEVKISLDELSGVSELVEGKNFKCFWDLTTNDDFQPGFEKKGKLRWLKRTFTNWTTTLFLDFEIFDPTFANFCKTEILLDFGNSVFALEPDEGFFNQEIKDHEGSSPKLKVVPRSLDVFLEKMKDTKRRNERLRVYL